MRAYVAICDDQNDYNEKLKCLLEIYFTNRRIDYKIISYTSGEELSGAYTRGKFDIVFLDVQMPKLNGLETAEQIRKKDLEVDLVFVTNMTDQMNMGFSFNAKGFLIKDVNQDQINELMDRLIIELHRRDENGIYRIKLKTNANVNLRLSQVLYFESHDKFIKAVTESDTYEFRGTLDNVEKDLAEKRFVRINRSLLVNVYHIFKDNNDCIVMKTSEKLYISRGYRKSVKKALNDMGV